MTEFSKGSALSTLLFALGLFGALLFALGLPAHGQQPVKIPKLGCYMLGLPVLGLAKRHSVRVCAIWGMWRGKTFLLSGDLRQGKQIRLKRSLTNWFA